MLTRKVVSKIPILLLQAMDDYVHWHCSIMIDYCVKLSLVDETLCENCSHFTLKRFLLNSFGEMSFSEVLCKQMPKKKKKKKSNFEIFQSTLYMKSGSMPLILLI